jgi:hypothetical protein
MEGKARFIFPVIATAAIVFVASAAVTFVNIGPRGDFFVRWLSAFIVGWPVAAVTGCIVMPHVRTMTLRIVAWLEDEARSLNPFRKPDP